MSAQDCIQQLLVINGSVTEFGYRISYWAFILIVSYKLHVLENALSGLS